MILTVKTWWDESQTNNSLENITNNTKEEMSNIPLYNKKVIIRSYLDKEEIEFRTNIEIFLKQIIGKDIFGIGKIIDYHIFTEGVSSIVAKLITEDNKEYIFKSCKNFIIGWDNKTHIEAKSFEIWNTYWIKTPKIYQDSIIDFNNNKIPYIIMEYIQPTRKRTEDNEQQIIYEIGENIGKIAKSWGKWFGWIKKIEENTAIGEYETKEQYYDKLERKIIKNLTEKNLIGEKETIKFHKAIQTIKNDFDRGTKASLNHEDIQFDNIFLTEPITIFDPNVKLDHPLMDLATTEYYLYMKSIISSKKTNIWESKLWSGYEKIIGKKINKNIFNACLIIKIMQKIGIIYKYPDREEKIKKALELLDKIELESITYSWQ